MDSEKDKIVSLTKKMENASQNQDLDKDELIDELRTNQIELEIQNEQLQESQSKLEDSQRKYWDLYDFAPIGYLTLDYNNIIEEINLSGADLLERRRKYLIGRNFLIFLTPKSRTLFQQHTKKVIKTGMDRYCDLELVRTDGEPIDIHITTSLLVKNGIITFRIALVDISKSKQADELKKSLKSFSKVNRTLLALRHSSFAMMHAEDEVNYLNDVCKIIVDDCGYSMVWIGFAEDDKKVLPVVFSGFEDNYLKTLNITWDDTEHGNGPTGTAVRTGELCTCEDMQTDPKFEPWREEALKRGYNSSICIPIIKEEKILGAITIYSEDTNPFSQEEKDLLKELSDDVAYGVSSIRLRTEKEKADKNLEASQKKYQSLYNSMNEGVAIHDIVYDNEHKPVDYIIIDTNPMYEKIVGLKRSEIIGKTASEVYGTGKPPYLEIYAQVAETCESTEFETYFEPMGIDFRISIISPEKGTFYTIFEDITERKKAQEVLQQEHDHLEELVEERTNKLKLANVYNRSLIEASLDPLVTIGSDGTITDVNQSTENFTGYTRTELIGTYFSDYFTEPEKARQGYKKVFKDGSVLDYPLEIKNKNGHITPVLYNASVYKDESGKIIGVFAAARDITEIKKTAEENQKLANVVETSDDGIITKSLDGSILSWNKGAEQIYGYSKKEIIGKNISILAPPELEKEIEELIVKIKLNEKVRHYETRRLKKDGTPIDVSITLSPIFDDTGKLVAISNVSRDITERKTAERKLNEYSNSLEEKVEKRTKELERSNAELEHFAYVASHDLREPLRMITSFLQLLERRYSDRLDQDANEFIEYAVDGAKRLNDMINDLLEYSKVTSKEPILVPVNLEKVLDDVLINLLISTEEKKAIITHDPLPMVKGDEKLLTLLLQNLIGNGIKYNDKNPPKIHISSKKETNRTIISIKDNGIGIKPEHLERIFTIFQRLHGVEEYEGTGIGLAIAQKIVHQHGGEICVESEYGKGTTFYFTIPNQKF